MHAESSHPRPSVGCGGVKLGNQTPGPSPGDPWLPRISRSPAAPLPHYDMVQGPTANNSFSASYWRELLPRHRSRPPALSRYFGPCAAVASSLFLPSARVFPTRNSVSHWTGIWSAVIISSQLLHDRSSNFVIPLLPNCHYFVSRHSEQLGKSYPGQPDCASRAPSSSTQRHLDRPELADPLLYPASQSY